jgi:enoyl-CoA hydratase
VDAAEARSLGLAERVAAADDVLRVALEAAAAFAAGPRQALAAAKAAIRAAVVTPGPTGIAEERSRFLQLFGTADQREGMRAFIEKRPPSFG